MCLTGCEIVMKRWVCWNHKQFCLDKLRCEQLSSDHRDGMRGRVECLQHSSDMKSHVSE